MDQLARAEPVDQDTSGGSSALAVAVLSSASAGENPGQNGSTEVRSASASKRNHQDLAPPPGLSLE
eukprot:1227480-Amphidinium_carterae.1